eukprot:Awhi_evm1s14294
MNAQGKRWLGRVASSMDEYLRYCSSRRIKPYMIHEEMFYNQYQEYLGDQKATFGAKKSNVKSGVKLITDKYLEVK